MYWLGQARWDSGVTPPEVIAAFQAGDIPPGPALDLGCGTGTNVIYMANQGRQAIGIDFAPEAVARARKKAKQAGVSASTQFYVGDVTRLSALRLPRCAYALDMGCFHGLDPDGEQRYLGGLSALLLPGASYMLYAMEPREQGRRWFGVTPEHVQEIFKQQFDIQRIERGEFRGNKSSWFWMKKKE